MKKRQVVVWALTLVMVLSCTWNLLISVSAEETDNSTTRVEYDYDYEVSYDELMTRDNHDVYLYTNQVEETLTLNIDKLRDKNNWDIEFGFGKNIPPYDPEEDYAFVPFEKEQFDVEKLLKYDKAKSKVTLYVQELMKFLEENLKEKEIGELTTMVKVGDEVVYERGTPIVFLHGGCDLELPNQNEYTLPNWEYNINRILQGKQYGQDCGDDGKDITTTITKVDIDITEGNDEAVHLETTDDGWHINADDCCNLRVTYTYEDPENAGETLNYTFNLTFCSEIRKMGEIVSDLGRNQMTMEETMHLQVDSISYFWDEKNECYTEKPKLEYVWSLDEEGDHKAILDSDKNRCKVAIKKNSDNDTDSAYGCSDKIICTAYLLDEEGNPQKNEDGTKVLYGEREFIINIRNYFYCINLGDSFTSDTNIEVGDSIKFTPTLEYIFVTTEEEYGAEAYSEAEKNKIYAAWDSGAFQVNDSGGKEVTSHGEKVELKPGETYKLTRTRSGESDFDIWGLSDDEEVAFRNIKFSEVDYSVFYDRTTLRDEGNTKIFTDEDGYKITLDTRSIADETTDTGLRKGLSIDWSLGYFEQDDDEDEGVFVPLNGDISGALTQGKDKNTNTVTLNGTALKKIIDEEKDYVELQARVLCNGKEIQARIVRIEVTDSQVQVSIPDEEEQCVLLNHVFTYGDEDRISCWVQDKEHMNGENFEAKIVGITANNINPTDGAEILKVTHEDGTWKITAKKPGKAEITYKISYEENGKTVETEVKRTKEVVKEFFAVDVYAEDFNNCVVPGQTLNLATTLSKVSYNENSGKSEFLFFDSDKYSVSYESSDENIVTVDEKGIVSAIGVGEADIYATAVMGDITIEGRCWVQVVEQYSEVASDSIQVELGDVVSAQNMNLKLISYTQDNLDGTEQKLPSGSEVSLSTSDECFIVNDDGTLKVKDNFEAKQWPYKALVGITVSLGEKENYFGSASIIICKHNWKDSKIISKATCEKDGKKEVKCEYCGKTKEEKIQAAGHKKVTLPAVAATENSTGLTEGTKCSVCGTILVAQKEVPKLPASQETPEPEHQHVFKKYVSNKDATVLADGTKTAVCSCGEKNTITAKGSKLEAVLRVSASSFALQTKQEYKKFTVTMGKGDYIVSVKSDKTKLVQISNLNKKKGTFNICGQKKTGTAIVTIKLASGKTQKLKIAVQKKAIKTKSISGLKGKITLKKGRKITLKPVISPITSKQKITYKTSNQKVATISSQGVILAKKKGTAKITVKSGNRKKTVNVTVK